MLKNFVIRTLISFILIFLYSIASWSQSNIQAIEKLIDNEVDSIKRGSVKGNRYVINPSNEKHFFNYVKKYENSTNPSIYFFVQRLRYQTTHLSKDTLLRQEAVETFIKDLLKNDVTIKQYALARLNNYKENDFSKSAKKLLAELFDKNINNELILICGTAQVTEVIPKLKVVAKSFDRKVDNWFRSIGWHANLALARMGEVTDIDKMITAVELELNPTVRVVMSLRKLAYTRNEDCIRLLIKYLFSTERYDLFNRGVTNGVEYSQFAASYLAEFVVGFPLSYKEIGISLYSKEEIELARGYFKKKER